MSLSFNIFLCVIFRMFPDLPFTLLNFPTTETYIYIFFSVSVSLSAATFKYLDFFVPDFVSEVRTKSK